MNAELGLPRLIWKNIRLLNCREVNTSTSEHRHYRATWTLSQAC